MKEHHENLIRGLRLLAVVQEASLQAFIKSVTSADLPVEHFTIDATLGVRVTVTIATVPD